MPAGLLLFVAGSLALWSELQPSVSGQFTDVCQTFPKESESCGEPKNRFFYNSTSKACQPFVYRGCPETRNRFYTVEECQRHCGHVDICKLPADAGPCDKKVKRWFYDWPSKQCKRFIFGGCLGNKNSFQKRRECQAWCGQQAAS